MGKTKCIRDFECEICHRKGMLQILTKNYARVRHYVKLENGKPVFEYHRNSMEYVKSALNSQIQKLDLIGQNNIDLKLKDSSSNQVRGVGFEPTNPYGTGS